MAFVAVALIAGASTATALSVGGIGAGLISTGVGMATKPGQPSAPNMGSSSMIASMAATAMLPIQRGLDAAYQTGGSFTYTVPEGLTGTVLGDPGTTHTVNFSGTGEGDVQAAIAKKTAANNLVLAQKYDSQFIAEALKQEALADPESVAARAEMNNLVRGQIDRPIEAPVADMLNQQVGDSMTAARQNRLTGMDQSRLDAAVAEAQGARGGAGPAADFAKPLTSGFAGEQRQQQATQGAMGFLSSGSSPEDIAYRRNQQNLANLSAEANRKTPQSQFSSLSGAQNGPTPIQTKAPLSVMPEGQAAGAQQAALSTWNTQMGQANSTVDPWLVGLTGAMQLGNTATSIVGQKRS